MRGLGLEHQRRIITYKLILEVILCGSIAFNAKIAPEEALLVYVSLILRLLHFWRGFVHFF